MLLHLLIDTKTSSERTTISTIVVTEYLERWLYCATHMAGKQQAVDLDNLRSVGLPQHRIETQQFGLNSLIVHKIEYSSR